MKRPIDENEKFQKAVMITLIIYGILFVLVTLLVLFSTTDPPIDYYLKFLQRK